jgi:hypothetical protein
MVVTIVMTIVTFLLATPYPPPLSVRRAFPKPDTKNGSSGGKHQLINKKKGKNACHFKKRDYLCILNYCAWARMAKRMKSQEGNAHVNQKRKQNHRNE